MKKKNEFMICLLWIVLLLFIVSISGCQVLDKISESHEVTLEEKIETIEKSSEEINGGTDEPLVDLSFTGQLAEDIVQLCELEKNQGRPMNVHDIDGNSTIITFFLKEGLGKFDSYSYILSEKQGLIRLDEFSSAGSWTDLKLTPGGAQGFSREEETIKAFSWEKNKITDQEKITVSNQFVMDSNLLYAYTDDFSLEAYAETNKNWTQELIIKDLVTGEEKTVRTYQTDGTAIKQIFELIDFYFLNENQLLYVGQYFPAEGQQSQHGYGIIDLTSEQKDSMYEGNVTLRSETGCIVVLEEDYLFKEGKPTGKVLIYQRENESWITVTLPDSEKMSTEICISRSGKYLLVPYFERTTETWEGRLFESATGKIISTIDMNLENGTQKMIENFCILEDQGQILYFNSNGTVEVITF